MILRLQSAEAPRSTGPTAAWPVVESIQRGSSAVYHVVTQPDHARISGTIAANFCPDLQPDVTPEVVQAIALHDEGWTKFEGAGCPAILDGSTGRPLTFLDAPPELFLQAWCGSIEVASAISATGEFIVSRHFRKLAERRAQSAIDPPETIQRIRDFVVRQGCRELDLLPLTGCSEAQLEGLVKLLQFCDLLSLVICSGASGTLGIPDAFGVGPLQLSPAAGGYELRTANAQSALSSPVEIELAVFEVKQDRLVPLPPERFSIR